jgi:hypothetical protein
LRPGQQVVTGPRQRLCSADNLRVTCWVTVPNAAGDGRILR